jgi:transmembrane sensor
MKHSYEQVFQLFMEKLSGNLSPADEVWLRKKLAEDASFKGIWQLLEAEAQQLKADEFLNDLNAAAGLQELKQQLQVPPPSHHKRKGTVKKMLAMAAVLLLVVTGAWFAFFQKETAVTKEKIAVLVQQNRQAVNLVLSNGQTIDLDKAGSGQTIALGNTTLHADDGTLQYTSQDTMQNTLWVPAGENYKIVLSDGTEVWLNAATRLRFPFRFGNAWREVYVEGEAYFKVAKDTRHPFIVHTPLTDVKVVGTAFNVNTYREGNVQTALVEGKVITQSKNGKDLVLDPGYEASFEATKGFATGPFDADEVLSWMNGVYYFHNMPVTELARVASRFYGVNIILDKEKFAGKSITGLMDKNKLINFLSDLEAVAHTTYHFSGKDLYLR